MNYFDNLLRLLKIEREADQKAYLHFTSTVSVTERRTNGQTWYPVAITGTELGRGAYLTIAIERTSHQEVLHQFRFGSSVALFSNLNPTEDRITGNIAYLNGNHLKINLRVDDLPEWTQNGRLGLDLLFDEYSYEEMQKALNQASALLQRQQEAPLLRVLLGDKAAEFNHSGQPYISETLNEAQRKAVEKISSAAQLAIVHGPPGTGKTTTLVAAIQTIWANHQKQLLVVAPSNTAVDLLTEKLNDAGLNVIRIGNPIRVSERLMDCTLDEQMAQHPEMKEIRKLKKQANQFRDMAYKYKRHFGQAEREQRKALLKASGQLMKEVETTEKRIAESLLDKAQVVTATLVGSVHYTIQNRLFDTVVIDEAGQALEPACWIPILKANKVILAGDPYQLPPTLKSNEAAANGLSKTLLEKCMEGQPEAVVELEEQYRMHESIMRFPSGLFYRNRLIAHPSVAGRQLFAGDQPLQFIDTAGCGFEEKVADTSLSNPEEASFLIQYLIQFTETLAHHYEESSFPSIAVISPYKEQVLTLKSYYAASPLRQYDAHISINTIDSFQGQERDFVCISMTRSNNDHKIGFLSDIRRMNVAMTRARKKLAIIGDSTTLSSLSFYADLIAFCEKNNYYHSAWEFISL